MKWQTHWEQIRLQEHDDFIHWLCAKANKHMTRLELFFTCLYLIAGTIKLEHIISDRCLFRIIILRQITINNQWHFAELDQIIIRVSNEKVFHRLIVIMRQKVAHEMYHLHLYEKRTWVRASDQVQSWLGEVNGHWLCGIHMNVSNTHTADRVSHVRKGSDLLIRGENENSKFH